MGLLKHVLLPACALMHGASAAACIDLKTWAKNFSPKETVSEEDEKSVLQNQMLGVVRGFNVAMLALCGMAVFKESAHFRAQVILAEFALFSMITVDAYRLKVNYIIPGVNAILALGGFIINSMEPGIFTKDKNA